MENKSSHINFSLRGKKNKSRPKRDLNYFLDGISKGSSTILGQAVTLIESRREADKELAEKLIEACLKRKNRSLRIGVTGTPGVGKSTFIESMGLHAFNEGKKVAVLAIDPSSQLSRGSILGDKTRMEKLSANPSIFIRPTAARDALGGVAQNTKETIVLCEAAGFDTIFIETVGVGQSEFAVHAIVDFFLLLILPGSGDELQGIKRGIVEMADLLVINKSDGERKELAKQSKRDYRNALHLFSGSKDDWQTKVLTCSSLNGEGIEKIWESILLFEKIKRENGQFDLRRKEQSKYWLQKTLEDRLKESFFKEKEVKDAFEKLEGKVSDGEISPFKAANKLLELFFQNIQK